MRRVSQRLQQVCRNSRSISAVQRCYSVQLTSNVAKLNIQPSHSRALNYGVISMASRGFSSYPAHVVVPMPALSPTMEVGSIAKWNLSAGDHFEAGTSICEVETDKATVTYEATEEGYIAKILVGKGEVKVGDPLMITVEEKDSVAAFADYVFESSAAAPAAPAKTAKPVAAAPAAAATSAPTSSSSSVPHSVAHGRVVASPLARKLARESGKNLSVIVGTGPNGRIIAADVLAASATAASHAPASTSTTTSASAASSAPAVSHAPPSITISSHYSDYELSNMAAAVAARQTAAKQQVPHYYLSVDLDMTAVLKLRAELNKNNSSSKDNNSGLSVQDFVIKAAAMAMKQVPDVNGSWMETFVRRYHQVDINVIMSVDNNNNKNSNSIRGLVTPVIRDCTSKGLQSIAKEIASLEDSLFADDVNLTTLDASKLQPGTFSIHNLGVYGVKSASPIVLSPQACALSMGAIVDTVVPNVTAAEGSDNWKVSPLMTVTLSCDHRVVDGAVGAQWLQSFKTMIENPITMIL